MEAAALRIFHRQMVSLQLPRPGEGNAINGLAGETHFDSNDALQARDHFVLRFPQRARTESSLLPVQAGLIRKICGMALPRIDDH